MGVGQKPVWTSHYPEHGASWVAGLELFPWCVQWPLGEIFHPAQTCALGLGFQGLGVSSLHLLPLLGSVHHALRSRVGGATPQWVRGRGSH